MPYTFLDDFEVERGRQVAGDKEFDALLQRLRSTTGADWIIRVYERRVGAGWFRTKIVKDYRLFESAGGVEWGWSPLETEKGSELFFFSEHTRIHIINFINGYLEGIEEGRRSRIVAPDLAPKRPIENVNVLGGYVDIINDDVPTVVRWFPESPISILLHRTTRLVVGYRFHGTEAKHRWVLGK